MGSRDNKFRLRLNLFDGIVLVLALAVGAALLWSVLKPAAAPAETGGGSAAGTVRYTIQFQRCLPGTVDAIHPGDRLTDSVRNYELGRVVSAAASPARALRVDHSRRAYVLATMDGFEDIDVVVEAPCTVTDEAVTLGSGYVIRTGASAFVQGDGYLASGFITAVGRVER